MATVLIWMSPESGHLVPTIKFGIDLLRRQHRVVYLTCGHIRDELGSLGFETIPSFSDDDPVVAARSIFSACRPTSWLYQHLRAKLNGADAYINEVRRQIKAAAEATKADLVLVDGVLDSLWKLRTSLMLRGICPVARIFVHLPYTRATATEGLDHVGATIYLSPHVFELPELLEMSAIYTEASIFHCPDDYAYVPDGWLSEAAPLVYCSLGTQAELYGDTPKVFEEMLRMAAQLSHYRFIVACGSAYRDEYRTYASNVQCVPFVALGSVLQHARVAIFNGGFGTLKACISFGVPMLIVPQKWDQPANGARIERHGIGVSLPSRDVNSQRLSEALQFLAEDVGTARRIRAMRTTFLETERQELTANLCENLLSGE